MNSQHSVDSFVASVRHRLNRHSWWHTFLWSIVIGSGAMVIIGLFYVMQGYAVPTPWYAAVAALTFMGAFVAWLTRRVNSAEAAKYADGFFALQDSVTACRNFAKLGRCGGFYGLQAHQTEHRVRALQPAAIKFQWPRGAWLAAVLSTVAVLLGFVGPSDAVQQQLIQEQLTVEQTSQINEELKKQIDELEQQTDDAEKELIDPNQLRRWVDELAKTPHRKEALRQYANLERKFNKALARLEQKQDEQLLDRAAKELEKDRDTKQLADTLKQKKYDDAAQELQRLEPKDKRPLDQQEKELARLKAAAKRMAAAARSAPRQGAGKQSAKQNRNADSKSATPKAASGADASQSTAKQNSASSDGDPGGELSDMIEDLEEAVEDYDEALAEAKRQQMQQGELDERQRGECQACRSAVAANLDRLGKKLNKMALRRRAGKRLSQLCQACSQCQGELCESPNPGGKEAGRGSSDRRRDAEDALVDNGQTTRLKGIKGVGPSHTSVESADEGSGVSTRRHVARERTFKRQFESFVQREDVPENVRDGVKRYFENIHQADAVSIPETP